MAHLSFIVPKDAKNAATQAIKAVPAVHELLGMTQELRSLVYKEASVNDMKKQAANDGMRTLVQDAIFKVIKGDTDLAQVQIVGGE